ncbi:MAG: hydroxyethylthiazole kinase-like uncharacterized protein yjeF [Myxococcota bacterium]
MSLTGPDGDLPLLTAAQSRAADEAAVAAGDSWDGLVARAGAALARVVIDVLQTTRGGVYGRPVLVAVGKGDNGGDGWVAAAHLRARGAAVSVIAPHGLHVAMSPHSGRARAAYLAVGGRATGALDALDVLSCRIEDQPVIVDCLLGTGVVGAPRGVIADAIDRLALVAQNPGVAVIACDIASGVHADSGAVAGRVVRADITVTFGAAKRGHALHPGASHAGRVIVAGLGGGWAVESMRAPDRAAVAYATDDAAARVAPWPVNTDKVARGRVLLVAGSRRYTGAAVLAGAAAVRAGAGLVTVATAADRGVLLGREAGMMVHQLDDDGTDVGGPAASAAPWLRDAVPASDVVVVGPGLGHGAGARAVVEAVMDAASPGQTIVLDADALNVFRHDAASLHAAHEVGCNMVLTPHMRELARLLDVDVASVEKDRVAAARQLADLTGAIVVAKGPGTLVLASGKAMAVVTSGGPALGTGGTGDVLAGMLGADLAAAARSGLGGGSGAHVHDVAMTVHRHGMLGDRAGARSGGRATAADLLDLLPGLLADLATPTNLRPTP